MLVVSSAGIHDLANNAPYVYHVPTADLTSRAVVASPQGSLQAVLGAVEDAWQA